MDQIPFTVAASIGAALVGAIAVMWKVLTSSSQARDKECKARVTALESKVTEIYTMMAKRADGEISKAEKREQQAMDQAVKIAVVLEGVGELTRHTIRILRRHDPTFDLTPPPGEDPRIVRRHDPTTDKQHHTPSYEKPLSDETSRFVKDRKQQ